MKYEIKPSRGTMRRARKYLKKLSQRLRREELIKERGTMVRESAIVYEEQLCELLSLMKDASDALDVRVRGLSLSLATHKNNDFYLRGVSDDVGVGIEELEIALESIKGCVEDIKEELANEVNNAE